MGIIQQNIWHAALGILVLRSFVQSAAGRAREGGGQSRRGVAAFPCPDHSAVAKAHHKNVNEVDRQRAKTHHSKGTTRETHRDPEPSLPSPLRPNPIPLHPTHTAHKKRQPIERNIC